VLRLNSERKLKRSTTSIQVLALVVQESLVNYQYTSTGISCTSAKVSCLAIHKLRQTIFNICLGFDCFSATNLASIVFFVTQRFSLTQRVRRLVAFSIGTVARQSALTNPKNYMLAKSSANIINVNVVTMSS
jgi:predicted naringenin-chalcone synthase